MTTESSPRPGATSGVGVAGLEPIAREPTASLIARRIRQAIVDGVLAPGTQLTEMKLAQQLDVSRAPLREALQRLIQEGLAENRRRGVFVRELSAEDVADVYFARAACEVAAVDPILTRAEAVPWGVVEDILQRLEGAARAGDWRATMDADRSFHQALVAAAESPRLARMFDTLIAETALCLRALADEYNDFAELAAEHRRILEALREGDRAAAIRAVNDHMADAVGRLASGQDADR